MGSVFSRVRRGASYDLVRVALGAILLLAAGLKAHQLATDPLVTLAPRPSSLAPLPASLAPLLHSRPFLIAVVECELLFGLVLLSGIFGKGDRSNLPERPDQPPVGARCFAQIGPVTFSEPKVTWALSLLCFGGFALISLYKGISGDASCGCFGRVPVNPWYTFTLDAAAVLALLRWRPRTQPSSRARPLDRLGFIVPVWFLIGMPIGVAVATPPRWSMTELGEVFGGGRIVILKPETWVGKRFPLLDYIDIGRELSRGGWTVVLYDRSCSRCEQVISLYETGAIEFSGGAGAGRVALVEVRSQAAGTIPLRAMRTGDVRRQLSGARNWVVSVPVTLVLSDGTVVSRDSGWPPIRSVSNDADASEDCAARRDL